MNNNMDVNNKRMVPDAPDELQDMNHNIPSILTLPQKESLTTIPMKTNHSTLLSMKRGSKRANALLGMTSSSSSSSSSSRVLVSSSRSLSLPAPSNQESLNLLYKKEQQDEVSSNRSVGAVSDSGHKSKHILKSRKVSDEGIITQSNGDVSQARMDKFRQISNNAQQRKKLIKEQSNYSINMRQTNLSSGFNFDDVSGNDVTGQICMDSEYSNISNMLLDQNSRLSDDTFMNSYNGESNVTLSPSIQYDQQRLTNNDQSKQPSLFSLVQGKCSSNNVNSDKRSVKSEYETDKNCNFNVTSTREPSEGRSINSKEVSSSLPQETCAMLPLLTTPTKTDVTTTNGPKESCGAVEESTKFQDPASLTSSSALQAQSVQSMSPRKSMCFPLEGRVTSVATTCDGLFIIVGFATGVIKVYDLNFGETCDVTEENQEDKHGHILSTLATSKWSGHGTHGFYRLYVEMGRALISNGSAFSAHAFVGARLGSTKIVVVDLLSLQRLRRKRGFLTLGMSIAFYYLMRILIAKMIIFCVC